MKRCWFAAPCLIVLSGLSCSQSWAQAWPPSQQIQLTYNPGTSHKIEQIMGDCDWAVWDATITLDGSNNIINPDPTCVPTISQTVTRADVLGQDTAYSFEHDGEVIFLFGDTIGATPGLISRSPNSGRHGVRPESAATRRRNLSVFTDLAG
jgi:hypothetical protein